MADATRQITISRNGQRFGPYAEDVARQLFNEGKLQGTDLAWHPGAEGWKPLSEMLAPPAAPNAAPPPPDAPSATDPAPDVKVHISRKDERMGPYPLATAKEYFAKGTLLAVPIAGSCLLTRLMRR